MVGILVPEIEGIEGQHRRHELWFKSLYQFSPISIELYNAEGVLIDANPACLELFGVSDVKHILGVRLFDNPNFPSEQKSIVRNGKGARYESSYDFEVVKENKLYPTNRIGIIYIDVSVTPLLFDGEGVFGYMVQIQDVTERRRAEGALREREAMYRNLIETTATGYVIMECNGIILDANLEYVRLTGRVGLADVIGKSPIEWTAPYDLEKNINALRRCGIEGMVRGLEIDYANPDGKIVPVEINATVVDIGGVRRIMSLCRDITQRRHAENELQRLKDHLANIIDSMPSMIVGMNQRDEVTQWNKQAETQIGISSNDAIGKSVADLLWEFSPWIKHLQEKLKKQMPGSIERVLVCREGKRYFYNMMLYPLVTNHEVGAVLKIEDVTEQLKIRELLVQTEKMMSLGGLAGGIAHELNNPLGIITQAVQNIERRVSPQIETNRKEAEEVGVSLELVRRYFEKREVFQFIEDIQEATGRAARIVANMLQFSRKSESYHTPESLVGILDRAIELAQSDYSLKNKYDFKAIEIVREYEEGVPLVPVAAIEIEQVILNLLKNAAEAMAPDRGVGVPRITLRLKRESEYVLIEVEDNGPGMEEHVLHRIFEPFFTTKAPGIGTGLGLSVSYAIITGNHKGLFDVESSSGNGSRFSIRLPISEEVQNNG